MSKEYKEYVISRLEQELENARQWEITWREKTAEQPNNVQARESAEYWFGMQVGLKTALAYLKDD